MRDLLRLILMCITIIVFWLVLSRLTFLLLMADNPHRDPEGASLGTMCCIGPIFMCMGFIFFNWIEEQVEALIGYIKKKK